MNAGPLLDVVVAGSLAFGLLGIAAAWRMRAQVDAQRLLLEAATEREGRFVEAARRLSGAAGVSVETVREEMDRAVRAVAPSLDVVLFFEEHDAQLVCVAGFGERADFFSGTRLALDDDASLIVAALRCGHRVVSVDARQARVLQPGDVFAAAIPLVLDAGRRCVLYVASGVAGSSAAADRIVQLVDQAAPA
ncbi:MAG: hypothetical protein ABSB70_22885 [Candidatus Velthaea sp.]